MAFALNRVISWFQSCLKNWNHEHTLKRILALSTLLALLQAPLPAQKPSIADLVVINAKVRTMTSNDSVSEALAVSGNRIFAVGSNKLIRTLIGPSTRVIDAERRLLLPGFNDAHVHFMALGNTFSSLDLRYVRSAKEMLDSIARFSKFLPKGRWILGGNWNDNGWKLPDRSEIDMAAPDNPVLLYKAGGTSAVANSFPFRIADLDDKRDLLQPNVSGKPSGLLFGQALKRVAAIVPKDHTTNWIEIAETATNYAASVGVTSVQDMHSDDSRSVYLELQRQGKLKTRVYDCLPLRDWKKLNTSRLPNGRDAMVTDGCLKSFSDGDEDGKASLLRDVTAADAARLQIMIHAIGLESNRIVLDVFDQAAKTNGRRDRRFRVEHAHKVRDEDLRRFSRSGIIASMQPHLFDGSPDSRFGTLVKQRALVAFGSDASMIDLNPMLGIASAVDAGSESISVYEAVRAYTMGSAFAEFREKEKGTIEVGRLADFVILSDDIFTIGANAIRNASVIMTVVDGKIVFEEAKFL